jgi:flavodoxin
MLEHGKIRPTPELRSRAMSPTVLVVYYSMTGNSRRVAQELRQALGADIEEIREPHPRKGLTGVLRALRDAILRREPPILPTAADPSRYDLVVLGGPVWAGRFASPVRSFARRFGPGPKRLALFCTLGGRGADEAASELQQLMGRPFGAMLAIDAAHLEPPAHQAQLQQFLDSLPLGSPAAASASPGVAVASAA